uniref:Uncharacterized protein n=1 Tax=Anopheles farauti TaxID=69004 RepID=A0A182QFR0_9DIPT
MGFLIQREKGKIHPSAGGEINFIRQFVDVHIKTILHVVQNLCISLVRDECDGEALGTETTGTGHSMQVGIGILRHVVVEHDVHSFDIHTTPEQIRRNQDTLLEVLKLLVPGQTLLLHHATVDTNGREILLRQQLCQGHAALNRLHEYNHLELNQP